MEITPRPERLVTAIAIGLAGNWISRFLSMMKVDPAFNSRSRTAAGRRRRGDRKPFR